MNAIDILSEILRGGQRRGDGQKPSAPSGGDIFKDIFGRGATSRQPAPAQPSESDIDRQARELEDMLGVGRDRSGPSPSSSAGTTSRSGTDWGRTIPPVSTTPVPPPEASTSDPARQQVEAQVLIRAMVNAAKADGRLTREEQDAILQHLGGASREAIAFLQRELDAALDVRDFAWSVPLGMEYKVYAVSLSAIDLDTKSESDYLDQLAHGLRLPHDVRAQIHQRYGVPVSS